MENWTLECGGSRNGYFTRNIFIKRDELEAKRREFNNTDFYCCIYEYKQTCDEGPIRAPFYLDIDNHGTLENEESYNEVKRDTILAVTALNSLYGIPRENMKVYFSGAKGFHVIVDPAVFGTTEDEKLNDIYYLIAQDIKKHTLFNNIDLRYDRRRLFRVENTVNSKSGLYKIRITFQELMESTMELMKVMASKERHIEDDTIEARIVHRAQERFNGFRDIVYMPRERRMYGKHTKFKGLLPCSLNVLENGAGKGNRNNVTVAVASALFQCGTTYDEAMDRVLDWNSSKNNPALSDREVKRAVKSAHQSAERGMRFGCTKMKEYGYCVPDQCRRVK
jgi:hypothetical protein